MDPVGGYGQFCPVAMASEIVCSRWTPLVLRELLSGNNRYVFTLIHKFQPEKPRSETPSPPSPLPVVEGSRSVAASCSRKFSVCSVTM